jgi:hypothetical protein
VAWPVVSATADFLVSRAKRSSHPSKNFTLLSVIGPDEHAYITDSNTYTNAAAGRVLSFATEAAQTLGFAPPSLPQWKEMADSMLIPLQQFCLPWPNASTVGCPPSELVTIHPQYHGYHGQDINQADVALLQWPLHLDMDADIAAADLAYYARRSSGADTKGFYTGDSCYAIAMLFGHDRRAAEQQLALAFDHMLAPFNVWTETDPLVAAHNSTGNLNFLTGAGGFLENIVFGYGGLRYGEEGLSISASLPPLRVTAMTLRGGACAGGTLRLWLNGTHQTLSRTAGGAVDVAGKRMATWPGTTSFPLRTVLVTIAATPRGLSSWQQQ